MELQDLMDKALKTPASDEWYEELVKAIADHARDLCDELHDHCKKSGNATTEQFEEWENDAGIGGLGIK